MLYLPPAALNHRTTLVTWLDRAARAPPAQRVRASTNFRINRTANPAANA